jgi:hypothetical protein
MNQTTRLWLKKYPIYQMTFAIDSVWHKWLQMDGSWAKTESMFGLPRIPRKLSLTWWFPQQTECYSQCILLGIRRWQISSRITLEQKVSNPEREEECWIQIIGSEYFEYFEYFKSFESEIEIEAVNKNESDESAGKGEDVEETEEYMTNRFNCNNDKESTIKARTDNNEDEETIPTNEEDIKDKPPKLETWTRSGWSIQIPKHLIEEMNTVTRDYEIQSTPVEEKYYILTMKERPIQIEMDDNWGYIYQKFARSVIRQARCKIRWRRQIWKWKVSDIHTLSTKGKKSLWLSRRGCRTVIEKIISDCSLVTWQVH